MDTTNIRLMGKKTKMGTLLSVIMILITQVFICSLLYIFYQMTKEVYGKYAIIPILMLLLADVLYFIRLFVNMQREDKELQEKIHKYGEEELLFSIRENTLYRYREMDCSYVSFFTDEYIVSPGFSILKYNEIVRMSVKHVKHRGGKYSLIKVETVNGGIYEICPYIERREIYDVMDVCRRQNPMINTIY